MRLIGLSRIAAGSFIVEPLERRCLLAGIALDLSYGTQGKAVEDLAIDGDGDTNDSASSAALQADGKLVVVGSGAIARNSSQRDLVLLRFDVDGTRDTTFGVDGVVRFRQLTSSFAHSVIVLPDGRLLAGGTAQQSSTNRPLVLRYFANGRPDSSFGDGGVATASSGTMRTLAVLEDGKILGAGQTGGGLSALWRFHPDGMPDTSFGTNGTVSFNLQTSNQIVNQITLLEDGRFLAMTSRGVARFTADGSLDLTFGQNGFVADETISEYARQTDGGLIVAGVMNSSTMSANWKVSRYLESGQLDASFGSQGTLTIDVAIERSVTSILLQPDGKILLGGSTRFDTTYDDFMIVRLLPDGSLDPTFAAGGILVEPLSNVSGVDDLRHLVLSPENDLYAVGTTSLTPPHIGFSTGDNIAALRYRLDVPLNVDMGGPYDAVAEGSSFNVSAAGSSYPGGTITSYEWSAPYQHGLFVPTATGVHTIVTVPDSPSVRLGLRVTTSDGLRAINSIVVPVVNVAPVIEAPVERWVAVGTTINIAGRIVDPGQDTFTLNVNFGDGTAPANLSTSARAFSFNHLYAQRGTWPVTISVTDTDGDSTIFNCNVNVVHLAGRVFQDGDDNGVFGAATDDAFAELKVYLDLNANGKLDPGEPETLSHDGGDFAFDDLAPGTYQVRIVAPAGWRQTSPGNGFHEVSVSQSIGARCDFSFTQRARMTGLVFNDLNANGVRDPGEDPFSGNQIYIDLNEDGIRDLNEPLSFTNASGIYQFTNLAPGTYIVRIVPNSSHAQTAPPVGQAQVVTVEPAEVAVLGDFGICASARVSGIVFGDVNQNGLRDPGENIYLLAPFADLNDNGTPDPGEPQATFSVGASYSLTGLPPGTYPIRIHPAVTQTFPFNQEPHIVTLSLGQHASGRDFGFYLDDWGPPGVTKTDFFTDTFSHQLRIGFSKQVKILSSQAALRLTNLTTGQIIDSALFSFFINSATRTATFIFPGLGNGMLPDGNYRAELLAAGITDRVGIPMAEDAEVSFFVLAGDANRDGAVNLADFNILAANFGQSNRTFGQGDFNYDGVVNLADFNILASRFGFVLSGSTVSGGDSSQASSPFATATRITDWSRSDDALTKALA